MVVAETDAGHMMLLGPADLDTCDGSIDRLVEAIEQVRRTPRPHLGDAVTIHVGDPLPDIELVDHEGRPWRTVEMRGRPLVLVLHRHLA